jgi:putative PIN family toxin of toxin-antitoxin system
VRLVLDTNVVLSGLIWHGHPRRLLDLAKEEAVSLYTSSALLDELADVLSRGKWTAMLATRQTDAAYLMQRYGVLAKVVRPKPSNSSADKGGPQRRVGEVLCLYPQKITVSPAPTFNGYANSIRAWHL